MSSRKSGILENGERKEVIMDYRKYIAERLTVGEMPKDEIAANIVVPPDKTMGDYALPCFKFAKVMRKSPAVIAEDLKNAYITDDVIISVSAVNGYLNFKINRDVLVKDTLAAIKENGAKYGSSTEGYGKTICIDYSSVNIAKPFHIGHLSTTVIGGALYRLYKFLGYNTVGINHLGDYGTQFGKLIYAYKHWGSKDEVKRAE